MVEPITLHPPLTDEVISKLRSGDRVRITGVIYTARDMAHKYMVEGHRKGEKLPFDFVGQILYYTGPTPAPPGRPSAQPGRPRATGWTSTLPICSTWASRA